MGEIEPCHIHPALDQGLQDLRRFARRTNCTDNLCFPSLFFNHALLSGSLQLKGDLPSQEEDDGGIVNPEKENDQGAQRAVDHRKPSQAKNVPPEQLLGRFPEEAGEKGRLKGSLEMNFLVGNDLVDQKTHPKSEEEGNEVFQDESNDRPQL